MADYINVKIGREWKQLTADSSPYCNEPCAYLNGRNLYETFNVPNDNDLWRECDDGHDDELMTESADEIHSIWDGDRFYICPRKINQG